MFRAILDRLRAEPAAAAALPPALILLALAFGADLTGQQQAAILSVVAILFVLAGITRSVVTPVAARQAKAKHPVAK